MKTINDHDRAVRTHSLEMCETILASLVHNRPETRRDISWIEDRRRALRKRIDLIEKTTDSESEQ